MEEGLLGYNPAIGIKPLLLDDSIPREPFSREEVLALVEAATSEDWKGAVLFGAFTGLRLGDIASLSWGAVDLAAGMIRVTPKKTRRTKKEVVIPIHPELADFLERHPIGGNRDEAPVFPSLDGVGTSGGKGLSAQFVAIMKLAGVSRGESSRSGGEEGGEGEAAYRVGRVVYARGFHSLRHTFTSWLANEDIPEDLRMLLTGHSDTAVHRGYTHLQVGTLARAIKKVPALATPGEGEEPDSEDNS
jgi:integrase